MVVVVVQFGVEQKKQKKLAEIPDSVVAMVSALTAAKALQAFAEVWKSLSFSEKGKEVSVEALMYLLDKKRQRVAVVTMETQVLSSP